jgi:hypothetical protein
MNKQSRGGGVEMVSKESVDEQLKRLGFSLNSWGRAEIRELPHILLPGEEIYELVNGIYEGGFALAVATDVRLLLVDKKPMNYLTVEDIRFDMISEIDYSHRLLGAQINISTGFRDLNFRSYNQPRLRKLIGHVQHCMAEAKRQQSQSQLGQNQHLEHLNEQLQTYLKAQGEYQSQLKRTEQDNGQTTLLPQEPKPSHELSDYLFARSLLTKYEEESGKTLQPDLSGEPILTSRPIFSDTPLPSRRELHELWSAGVQEVFGSRHHHSRSATQSSPTTQQHNSFEVNPVSVVFSKLPMVIRSRKFSTPIPKLSSETAGA